MAIKKPRIKPVPPPVLPPVEPLKEVVPKRVLPVPPVTELPPIKPTTEPLVLPPVLPPVDVFSLLRGLYPERFDPAASFGFTLEEIPQMVLDDLLSRIQSEPDLFLKDLFERDGTGRAEQLLELLGVPLEEIGGISAQFVSEAQIDDTVTAVFPDLTPEEFIEFATEDWGSFLQSILEKGDTEETRDLLQLLDFNQSEINELFQVPPFNLSELPIGSYKITDFSLDDISKFALKDPLSFEKALAFEGRTPETMEILSQIYGTEVLDEKFLNNIFEKNAAERFISGEWLPDALEDYWGAFWTGAYDLISQSGAIADRLGSESVAENLKLIGYAGHEMMPDIDAKPFTPKWYALNLTRMVPMILGLIGVSLTTAGASSWVVAAAGGGRLLQTIVSIITAGAISSVGEGALEAGDAYQKALDRGFSQEEADAVFDKVLRNNIGLLSVTNTAQFGLTFFLPGGTTARFIVKSLIFGFDIVSEGLEEGVQLAITRDALGDPQKFDEEMWQNVTLGLAGGLGFAGVGAVFTSMQSRIDGKMTDEQRDIFLKDTGEGVAQGLTRREAEFKAYDKFAETPEGEAIITEAVNEIMAEEREQNVEEGKKAAESIEPALKGIEADTTRVNELVEETITPEEVPEVPEVTPEDTQILVDELKRLEQGETLTDTEMLRIKRISPKFEENIRLAGRDEAEVEGVNIAIEDLMTKTEFDTYRDFFFRGTDEGRLVANEMARKVLVKNGWLFNVEDGQWYTPINTRLKNNELIAEPNAYEVDIEALRTDAEDLVAPPAVEVAKPPVKKTPVKPEVPIEADNSGVDVNESVDAVVSDAVPIIREITVIERGRPSRKVFAKMGIYDIWESAFKQETLKNEELTRFNKIKKKHAKAVGRDAARRELVWEYVNNNKTELFNQMTFEEKRAASWFREFADEWADRLGIPLDQRIKNYITHIFDEQAKADKDIPINAAMAQMLDSKVREKVPMPFLKKRLGKEVGLIKDPFMAATAYENMALKMFYYQGLLEKIKLIAEHESTPEFAGRYLKDFSRRLTGEPHTIDREINEFINQVANKLRGLPGGTRLADVLSQGNPAGMVAYNLTSAMYVMWLGFKPTSAIRNLSQQMLALAEAGPIAFSEGYAKTLTAESRQATSESLVIRSRRGAFVESIDSTMIEGLPAKFREGALFLFRKADALNVRQAFLAGYYEAKRLYPDADRSVWIKRGDEVAADTQYLYTKLNSMAISQSAPGKIGAMLTTWAINFAELQSKWIQGKESRVYLDLVKTSEGRFKMPSQNWVMRRKALWTYLAIIGLLYGLKEQDWNRVKVWEYSGLTSLKTFANLIGGDFPALEIPGAVADVVVGVLLDDDRRLKMGWNKLKNSVAILNQLEAVASGAKDWLTLLFYLDSKDFRVKNLKEDWEKDLEGYPLFENTTERMAFLKENKEYTGLTDAKMRNKWREENPLLEAKKFIIGDFTKLTSDESRAEVLRLIEKHNLNPDHIDGYAKIFGADIKSELQGFQDRIGSLEKLVIGEEAKYFKTSNYLSEVNRLVKKHGMAAVSSGASPLTRFIIDEQTSWKWYDDFTEEGRVLVRQQTPELEASLYLFGKVSSFKNPKSAEILLGLMKKYNIPPEAVPAFIENPERYDELFTPIFELKQKTFDLSTEYENYANPESPLYIEDEDARTEARGKLKESNPEWVADMRRIEAYENEASEDIVEKWVDRGKTIDEFGSSSSQAKVWLLDNPEVHKWALENKLLTDDGSGWNEDILRINVELDKLDPESNEYRKLNYRKDAFSNEIPRELIDTYVSYFTLPKKPDDWLEGVAYYEDEWFLQENPEFYKTMIEKGIWEERDFGKVPPRDIFKKWWVYNTLTNQKDRDTYRLENIDLDEWGVSIGIWKTTMTEQRRRRRITPTERFEEDVTEIESEFDRRMKELEELLEGLR